MIVDFRITVVAIIKRGNEILIGLKNEPGHILHEQWVFPAGKLKWSEKPEETLIREVKEESGMKVNIKGLLGAFLSNINLQTGKSTRCMLYYICEGIGEPKPSKELKELKWVPLNNLKKYISEDLIELMPVEVKEYLML